jgi:rhodanese-related sulfurtransferase
MVHERIGSPLAPSILQRTIRKFVSILPETMAKIPEILKLAQQRGRAANLPYEGALLPAEAFELLTHTTVAVLVDVRTRAEIDWVGFVPGAIHVEWQQYPSGTINENFLDQLAEAVPPDALVMFLCRSGARSHYAAAAATAAGFMSCYNVLQGFEGDRDAEGHRNVNNGWRSTGLPWKQN